MRSASSSGGGVSVETSSAHFAEVGLSAPSVCRVTAEPRLGTAVFRLQGDIDTTTAVEVRDRLAVSIGESAVVLDLTGVNLIDAEGVVVLRDVVHSVFLQGGRVAIARPWRVANPILSLVGIDGFVFLAITAASAIIWLNDPANGVHQKTQSANDDVPPSV